MQANLVDQRQRQIMFCTQTLVQLVYVAHVLFICLPRHVEEAVLMRLDSIYTGIHRPNSTLPANVNDLPAL